MNRKPKNSQAGAAALATAVALMTSAHLLAAEKPPNKAPDDNGRAVPDRIAPEEQQLLLQARAAFGTLPETMPGSKNDTEAMVSLGKRLYFEKAMSINKTQSCNDCHRLDGGRAGVDNTKTSEGALGKFGPRNAPTVLNAGFHIAQFWDGRAADLVAQAKGPPVNPIEMGMEDGEAVAARIEKAKFGQAFRKAFPEQDDPITFDNIARAIAAFERTLISRGRFDDFVAGQTDALTSREKKGLSLVLNTGCIQCHTGPLLGGVLYNKIGVFHPYENRDDLGRFDATGKEDDKYVFKVPSLRNATLTAPYFHDGTVATLAEAVDLMGWQQLDKKLSNDQISSIVRFLTALADEQRVAEPTPDWDGPNWEPPDAVQLPQGDSEHDQLVRYGHRLLTDTYAHLGEVAGDSSKAYSGNALDCGHCHQNAGTKPYGIPWIGVTDRYPTYRGRADGMASLKDRINGCMQRSMDGRPLPKESREMRAMIAYMEWLGKEAPEEMTAVGSPALPTLPPRAANPEAGAQWYRVACQACHGADGSGYRAMSASDDGAYVVPALWGPGSYNNGAGMHRVLKSAGFIKANMPLGTPWHRPMLDDEQAYDIAAYINSQGRPQMDGLHDDYPDRSKKPIDCPYPPYADKFSRQQHKYGPFRPIIEHKQQEKKEQVKQ
jgi:cytochrome c peroxidase